MTEAQQLIADYRTLKQEAAGQNAYRRGKAAREIPDMEDRIRAMQLHLSNRLSDGFDWMEDNRDHPNYQAFEELWLDLLKDYEALWNALPSQYETGRLV